jgi:hypothetical protein
VSAIFSSPQGRRISTNWAVASQGGVSAARGAFPPSLAGCFAGARLEAYTARMVACCCRGREARCGRKSGAWRAELRNRIRKQVGALKNCALGLGASSGYSSVGRPRRWIAARVHAAMDAGVYLADRASLSARPKEARTWPLFSGRRAGSAWRISSRSGPFRTAGGRCLRRLMLFAGSFWRRWGAIWIWHPRWDASGFSHRRRVARVNGQWRVTRRDVRLQN